MQLLIHKAEFALIRNGPQTLDLEQLRRTFVQLYMTCYACSDSLQQAQVCTTMYSAKDLPV